MSSGAASAERRWRRRRPKRRRVAGSVAVLRLRRRVLARPRGVAERGDLLGSDHGAAQCSCGLVDPRRRGLQRPSRVQCEEVLVDRAAQAARQVGGRWAARPRGHRFHLLDGVEKVTLVEVLAGHGHLEAGLQQLSDLGDVRGQGARCILPAVAKDVDSLVGRDHGWELPPGRMDRMCRIPSACDAMVRSRRRHEPVRGGPAVTAPPPGRQGATTGPRPRHHSRRAPPGPRTPQRNEPVKSRCAVRGLARAVGADNGRENVHTRGL